MQIIIKILFFILAFILVFISFALSGSGQDMYFYVGCGFGLAGILVFMMSMRAAKKNGDTAADKGEKIPEEK